MFRLILLVSLFLVSLLTVFKAPTYHLWLGAVLVTEFSPVFILITLIALATGLYFHKYQVLASISGGLALILFLVPICQSILIARRLKTELAGKFGDTVVSESPLSITGMISGLNSRKITSQTFDYAVYSGKNLNLDFYPSKEKGNRPCVIVIHGGSWKSGNSKQLPELNAYLAYAGYHVIAINYRLAPQYQSPLAIEDVKQSFGFIKNHAEKLQIDSTNIVILGRSAGAQIALLAAYTLGEPGLKGVVDFYGPADMVWGYSAPSNPLVMNSKKVMEDYLGGTFDAVPENYRESSPLLHVSKASVPTLIIHGKNDVLVAYEHSVRLQEKLNRYKIPNYFLSLPWATHGFDYTINGPGGQLSTFAVKYFIDRVTSPSASPRG